MENKQLTAVEWLTEKFTECGFVFSGNIFEQAKQMEKEQIMIAVKDSWYMAKGSNFQEPQEEQYYNETYGSSTPELRYKDGSPMRKYNSPKLQAIEDEISDEDIKRGIKKEWTYSNYQDRHWMVEGAKWYREQLKKKQ